jgi:hypothetical protein
MNAGEPTEGYGYPTEQPDAYGWSPQPPEREPAFSMRTITLIVIGTAVAIILVGIIGGIAAYNRNTKLSHRAVERYIAKTYNLGVSCNYGHDMPVATGRTYTCVGSGVVLSVRLVNNHGGYEVEQAGSSPSQSS